MSEDLKKLTEQLTGALAKIAALETEIQPLRAKKDQPQGMDPRKLVQALITDPAGTLSRLGVPKEHVAQALVADQLGDQAPPQLRSAAMLGPQVARVHEIATEMEALRQRLDQADSRFRSDGVRESLKTISADKQRYPHLASAMAANPGLFDRDVQGHTGTADELAQSLESRLTETAKALGIQTARQANADDRGQESQTQATGGTTSASRAPGYTGSPPPLPAPGNQKGFGPDDARALRDEIVRNAERGVYNSHPYGTVRDA